MGHVLVSGSKEIGVSWYAELFRVKDMNPTSKPSIWPWLGRIMQSGCDGCQGQPNQLYQVVQGCEGRGGRDCGLTTTSIENCRAGYSIKVCLSPLQVYEQYQVHSSYTKGSQDSSPTLNWTKNRPSSKKILQKGLEVSSMTYYYISQSPPPKTDGNFSQGIERSLTQTHFKGIETAGQDTHIHCSQQNWLQALTVLKCVLDWNCVLPARTSGIWKPYRFSMLSIRAW